MAHAQNRVQPEESNSDRLGVATALLGMQTRGDVFEVNEYVYPPLGPQPPLPVLDDDK